MSKFHLYNIENGDTDVSYDKLGGLAKALRVDVSVLFERVPGEPAAARK